jgi:hypothetical protein
MSIKDNIIAVKKQLLNDVVAADPQFSKDLQTKALAAIQHGQGSAEWETYMKLFANSNAQLDRLTAKDATAGDPDMNQKRAYLAADGTCTPDTVLNFGHNASDALDFGLAE